MCLCVESKNKSDRFVVREEVVAAESVGVAGTRISRHTELNREREGDIVGGFRSRSIWCVACI